ncbi:unnamed protein product [Lymnaea stagnalis]|uniref:NACHT domain-containing protein n=1 Tax=Lymnaea stagnalis TaxID=6523 RepID=A0AAV2IIG7_LYMST
MFRRIYQQSSSNGSAASKDQAIDDDEDENDKVDETLKDEVNRVWLDVEKQCIERSTTSNRISDDSTEFKNDWNVVRVFVSSTFTDFFNEREILVKKVFPELREWCMERGLKLVECDLRWGIPRDTSTSETILVCLDEIENCRNTNKDKPFFINLAGERYGWIPSLSETPKEAKEKYGWVDGTSITFMEIMHGAYRDRNPNAAFFLRDKSVLVDVPETFIGRFIDSEPIAKQHLKVMKRKLKEKFPDQIFPYSCKFKEISMATGREQVEFTAMDTFAELVLTFLRNAIERTYPSLALTETKPDLKRQEKDMQWLFAVDKAKDFIGRHSELGILKDFVEHGGSKNLMQTETPENRDPKNNVRQVSAWDLDETVNKICILEGPSGWGKTALLCKLIVDLSKSDTRIFYHIINSTPSSNQVEVLLRRLLEFLTPEPTEEVSYQLENADIEGLQKQLNEALVNCRQKEMNKLILVIDGLNELESDESYQHLSWLPPSFPRNIYCIVSTSPHPPTVARLYEHPAFKMTLNSMTQEDLSFVVTKYLGIFNKRLEPSQLTTLLSNTGVDNPLWILLMAEELRIFGDFRLMDSKIGKFPNTMSGVLAQIIDRLIHEDENGVIKKVLCLIACSRHGLPSDQILKICGNVETKEELPPLYWARARRALKSYLRFSGRSEEMMTYSHQAVLEAVRAQLLPNKAEVAPWHLMLADYYQYWCNDPRAKCYHLPYHLEAAELKKRLVEFMQRDPDSYFYINQIQRSNIMRNLRCHFTTDARIPATAPLMLCHSCAMFTRGWNPGCNWPNKSCCAVCGAFCHQGFSQKSARACMKHANSWGLGKVKCVMCSFVVDVNTKNGPLVPAPVQLCHMCSFGIFETRCAHFDV